MLDRKNLAAVALLACVIAGWNANRVIAAPKVDTSDPKATAVGFAKALQAGDMATVKSLSVNGGEAEHEQLKAMCDMMVGFKKVNDAATAKFGAENGLPKELAMDIAAEVEKAEVKMDGDKATIHMMNKPDEKKPMGLVKKGGGWLIDLSSLENDANSKALVQAAPVLRKGLEEIAADITSGKIKAKEELAPALGKVFMAMMAGPEGAPPPPPPGAPSGK